VQLDWSTIVLEIINFLVLVWLLKRFLYQPVLQAIARRRAEIEASVADAEKERAEADSLRQQYQNRISDWERERAAARTALQQELDTERRQRLNELRATLESEREKAHVADARRLAESQRQAEQQAVIHSAQFAAKLLTRLSGAELDTRLIAWATEALVELTPERRAAIRNSTEAAREAQVLSARALGNDARKNLEAALRDVFGAPVACTYDKDAALIAGLRITVGPWVLRANLQDELQGIAELAHESGIA
jgi:F-type H+-transporting ATPase subunit b